MLWVPGSGAGLGAGAAASQGERGVAISQRPWREAGPAEEAEQQGPPTPAGSTGRVFPQPQQQSSLLQLPGTRPPKNSKRRRSRPSPSDSRLLYVLALPLFLLSNEVPLGVVRLSPNIRRVPYALSSVLLALPLILAPQPVPASLSLEKMCIVTPLRWFLPLGLREQTVPPAWQRAGVEADGALGHSKHSPSLRSALEG